MDYDFCIKNYDCHRNVNKKNFVFWKSIKYRSLSMGAWIVRKFNWIQAYEWINGGMSKRRNPTDTDENNNETQGPSVAKILHQRFKDSYKEAFPFLTSSKKGPTFAYCLVCEKDFSCAHGGKHDCRRHAKSKSSCGPRRIKTDTETYSFCVFFIDYWFVSTKVKTLKTFFAK